LEPGARISRRGLIAQMHREKRPSNNDKWWVA